MYISPTKPMPSLRLHNPDNYYCDARRTSEWKLSIAARVRWSFSFSPAVSRGFKFSQQRAKESKPAMVRRPSVLWYPCSAIHAREKASPTNFPFGQKAPKPGWTYLANFHSGLQATL